MATSTRHDWKIFVEVILDAVLAEDAYAKLGWSPLNDLSFTPASSHSEVTSEIFISDSGEDAGGGVFQVVQVLIAITETEKSLEEAKLGALKTINSLPLGLSNKIDEVNLSLQSVATWSFYIDEHNDEEIYFEFGEGLAEAEYETGEFEDEMSEQLAEGSWTLSSSYELIWATA